jgi:hypothetical protein
MNRRKVHLGAAVLALVLGTLACTIFDSGPPRVENARLAKDEKGEQTTATFGQEDTFYLVGDLKGASQAAPLKVIWTAVQADALAANSVITETVGNLTSGPFHFSLFRKDGYWPAGQFKAELHVGDQAPQSFAFQVERTIPTAFKDVQLSQDEEGKQPATAFGQEDTFFLTGELVSAPDQTPVKVVWTAVDAEGEAPGTVVHEENANLSSGPFSVYLQLNSGYWKAGNYQADLYLNGELKETKTFQVTHTLPPVVTNARLAADQDGTQLTTTFQPADTFYVLAEVENAPPDGALVKAVWTATQAAGVDANQVIDSIEQTVPNGTFWFNLVSSQGAWPGGQYQVELFVNGEPAESLAFEVSGPAAEGLFMARDAQGEQPGEVFTPQQDFNIVGTLVNAPQAAQVRAVWKAMAVEGLEAGAQINEGKVFDFQEGRFSVTLQRGGSPWKAGEYQVELLVNDVPAGSLNFLVTSTRLNDLALARDQNGQQRTTEFGAQDLFYLVFDVAGAQGEVPVKLVWKSLDGQGGQAQVLNESDYNFKNGGYYVSLSSDQGSWQPGPYAVDVYLNGYYYATLNFEVK